MTQLNIPIETDTEGVTPGTAVTAEEWREAHGHWNLGVEQMAWHRRWLKEKDATIQAQRERITELQNGIGDAILKIIPEAASLDCSVEELMEAVAHAMERITQLERALEEIRHYGNGWAQQRASTALTG
jgi:chromosome segregation ATPase